MTTATRASPRTKAAPARRSKPLPAIVFSHANGFPAGTYRALFEAWRKAGHAVHAVEKFGHDARFPVTNNWPHLRDELIDFVEHKAKAPVVLIGHSMGGYLSVLAASRRPELACGIVLLDAPILGDVVSQVMRFGKATGFIQRFSPGHVSVRRRQLWPDADAAYAHFAAKAAFARWAPGVLRDYIACGVERAGRGKAAAHRLAFNRETETAIYNAFPHHLSGLLRRHPLRCPLAFIGGTHSLETKRVGMRETERLTRGRVSWIEGSHLFPFEQPQATAQDVLRWLGQFRSTPAT